MRQQGPVFYMGWIMGVIYILVGIFLLLWGKKYVANFPPWFNIALGVLLVVYGLLRLSRFRNTGSQ